MREIRRLQPQDMSRNKLAYLTPRANPKFHTPFATISAGERAFFSSAVETDKVTLCWCFPATSNSAIRNYHAIPIKGLDVSNGILLLNAYLSVSSDSNGSEIYMDAMDQVLDGLEKIRPDKILCAESTLAAAETLEFLQGEGYHEGNPSIEVGNVSYLGAFCSPQGNWIAVGTNGIVFVNNIRNGDGYVGPIYIYDRAGNKRDTERFKGLAINESLNPHFREVLDKKYRKKAPDSDSLVDKIARKRLKDLFNGIL